MFSGWMEERVTILVASVKRMMAMVRLIHKVERNQPQVPTLYHPLVSLLIRCVVSAIT